VTRVTLETAAAHLDTCRRFARETERISAAAAKLYSAAWTAYEAEKEKAGQVMQVTVKSYSHLLEGSLVVERRAKFCDISGEEIPEGTGAKLVITKGESRWEADLSSASLESVLDTLNNPEEKKKRGRPAADAAKTPEPAKATA